MKASSSSGESGHGFSFARVRVRGRLRVGDFQVTLWTPVRIDDLTIKAGVGGRFAFDLSESLNAEYEDTLLRLDVGAPINGFLVSLKIEHGLDSDQTDFTIGGQWQW